MPISKYFHGHGSEVMEHMKEQYGENKGEQVFYATANKRGEKPATDEAYCARMHRTLDYVLDCMAEKPRSQALDSAPTQDPQSSGFDSAVLWT